MRQLLNNPDDVHVVINPRTGEKYAMPRSIAANRYTIADLVPVEKATVESCFTTQ